MARVRALLGLLGGGVLVVSSTLHSVLGWEAMRSRVEALHPSADLVFGLKVGWQWGGMAMLAFGVITIVIFAKRLRGESASAFPAVVVGLSYLIFGGWALVGSRFDPFFWIFIAPAVLLLVAATGRPDDAG